METFVVWMIWIFLGAVAVVFLGYFAALFFVLTCAMNEDVLHKHLQIQECRRKMRIREAELRMAEGENSLDSAAL